METKICMFEESAITFLVSKDNSMMVNATEMAKVFNKDYFNLQKVKGQNLLLIRV